MKITHNGSIQSDDLNEPGYVYLDPETYGLEPNHADGWHVAYQPLNPRSKQHIADADIQSKIMEHMDAPEPKTEEPGEKLTEEQIEKSRAFADWMTDRTDNERD